MNSYHSMDIKAFDRLNYWLLFFYLFDKLVKKCVPLFIIKLLCFWYTHKKMVVRWGTTRWQESWPFSDNNTKIL